MTRDGILVVFAASLAAVATSLGAFAVAAWTGSDLWFGAGLLGLLSGLMLMRAVLRVAEPPE